MKHFLQRTRCRNW